MTIKTFYLSVLIFSVISCGQRKPIDSFFRSIDKTLTKQEKFSLDSCKQIECWIGFTMMTQNQDFRKQFDSIPTNVLASMDTNKIHRYRELCLFIAYCKNRSNQKYDFIQILGEIDKYDNDQQIMAQHDHDIRRAELTKLADRRYQKIALKDTIILHSHAKYENGKWWSYYWRISPGDEILTLKCLVLNKWNTPWPNDSSDSPIYGLKIKILDFNKNPCEFHFKDLSKGDIRVVDIYDYEREIEIISK